MKQKIEDMTERKLGIEHRKAEAQIHRSDRKIPRWNMEIHELGAKVNTERKHLSAAWTRLFDIEAELDSRR
jgi:hypothetical protein